MPCHNGGGWVNSEPVWLGDVDVCSKGGDMTWLDDTIDFISSDTVSQT